MLSDDAFLLPSTLVLGAMIAFDESQEISLVSQILRSAIFLARHFDLALVPQTLEEVDHCELFILAIASLATFTSLCLLLYRTYFRGRKIASSLCRAVPFAVGSVVWGMILCPQFTIINFLRSSSMFLDIVAEIPQLDCVHQMDAVDGWLGVYYISVIGYVILAVVHRVHLYDVSGELDFVSLACLLAKGAIVFRFLIVRYTREGDREEQRELEKLDGIP